MNKETIIDLLAKHYNSFIDYINKLTDEEYSFSYQQKWTAGQQLAHMILCTKPLVQVFSLNTSTIAEKFGLSGRSSRSYDVFLNSYAGKLTAGVKAPGTYVPGPVLPDQRGELGNALAIMIKDLCAKIENFTDEDLDALSIPHPLFGSITMREMLYNMIHHVQHHHRSTIHNLKSNAM